jgi:exoribonuclease R
MGEAKVGQAFVRHEFDEAIAIHRVIVEAEEQLSKTHPMPEAKRAIKAELARDQRFLRQLEKLGKQHGASGKVEDVAASMKQLMEASAEKATQAPSEAYEAHAVLVSLKRKQQDSGAAMLKIARALKDTEMRDAAIDFSKETKAGAQELADQLAAFAVTIAAPRTNGRRGTATASTAR